ncbi:MAG: NAD(+) diphosphatase [Spirochaetaceae bacterium]|jgi:NAD+ diphosphatase|nr:NAD(+) diphosphatase [Spirochaetaceae bacterium]
MTLKLQPSRCLVFHGSELVAAPDSGDFLDGVQTDAVLEAFPPAEAEYFEVPLIDRSALVPCFYLKKKAVLPRFWRSVSARTLAANGTAGPDGYCGALPSVMAEVFRIFHIAQWLSESGFCGRCGERNTINTPSAERHCPACGRVEYPRVSPAVIVRVTNDDGRILLAHDSKFTENIYSLIAGFYEAGERLEDTVEREVFEEVGLKIKNIRYLASQSWPFPNSLMIGFAADCAGGEIRCDGVEIEDAQWFSRDSLPRLPGYGSIARFIIERWREGKD